jgi:anti-sigma factor RsiW
VSRGYECSGEGGDAAAYVLGALEPEEATAFERHMATCVVCRDEVDQFGHVVEVLALAPRQYEAPGELRRSVLRQIRRPRASPRIRFSTVRLGTGLAAGLAAAVVAVVAITGGGTPGTHVLAAQVIGVPGQAELRVSDARATLVVDHLPQPAAGHIYEVWVERRHGAPQPTKALFGVTTAGAGVVMVPGSVRSVDEVMVTQEPDGGSPVPTTAPVIVAHLT